MSNVLELQDIRRTFSQGGETVEVLRGVDLDVKGGEIVALLGPSGSGKSTLLHIAGLLERPSSGRIVIGGQDCSAMDDAERTLTRRHRIGFVYQYHHLLPEFSALENAAMPLRVRGETASAAGAKATELLSHLGLAHRLTHRPARLSGGEQQRVAIGRALANEPPLVLADEPTAALDTERGTKVMTLLRKIARERRSAVITVTHDHRMIEGFDTVYHLDDGHLSRMADAGAMAV